MILNLSNAIYISIGFFFIFLAYMSCSNISTKIFEIYGFNNLGFYTVSLVYLFFALMSPFASAVIMKMGSRFAVKFGSITYFMYIMALLLPTLKTKIQRDDIFLFQDDFIVAITIIFSCINGCGSALLWCGQGQYLTECSNNKSKGLFFAILQGTAMSSQFIGNLLAAVLLGVSDSLTYFIVMAAISLFASIFLFFLRKPLKPLLYEEQFLFSQLESRSQKERDQSVNNVIIGDQTGAIQTLYYDRKTEMRDDRDATRDLSFKTVTQQPSKTKEKLNSRQTVVSTLKLMKDPKMLILMTYMIQQGITLAITSGIFVPLLTSTMPDKDQKEQLRLSFLVLSALGAGEIFGGFSISVIVKRYQCQRKGLLLNLGYSVIAFGLLIMYCIINEYNACAYLFAFAFGLLDSASNTQVGTICGFEFGDLSIQAFGVGYLIKPLTTCIFVLIEIFIQEQEEYLIYFSICLVYYVISYMIMYLLFPFTEEHKIDKDDNTTTNEH